MTKQLSTWSKDSDLYIVDDGDLITIVVNSCPVAVYQFADRQDYFDKLVEFSVSGFKIPDGKLFAGML